MKSPQRKIVLIFGVFDLLHPGHVSFVRAAARRGEVTAVVTPDAKVLAEKGRRPFTRERDRVAMVAALKGVARAVLGDKGRRWSVVARLRPDIICVGHDQDDRHPKFLAQLVRLKKRPKLVRMAKRKAGRYSSSGLKKEIHRAVKSR